MGEIRCCLNMIIKNEEDVILRCLDNVGHLIDAVAIVDTGSTDSSIEKVNTWMKNNNKPGEIIQRPWFEFGPSRTEALRHGENVIYRISKGLLGPAGKKLRGTNGGKGRDANRGNDDKENESSNRDESNDPSSDFKYISATVSNKIRPYQDGPLSIDEYETFIAGKGYYNGDSFLREALAFHKPSEIKGTWYFLFMDADNQIVDNGQLPGSGKKFTIDKRILKNDSYSIDMRSGSSVYTYTWLVKFHHERKWIWREDLHEYVAPLGWNLTTARGKISGGYIHSGREGSRNRDPLKYLRDALVLERSLLRDPKNARNHFYLAQSYRDAGHKHKAIEFYLKRSQMEDWIEEVYLSYLRAAEITFELGLNDTRDEKKYLDYLYKGFQIRSTRLEIPFHIVHYYYDQQHYLMGWNFGRNLINMAFTSDTLFVDEEINRWKFYHEVSKCALKVGEKKVAKDLILKAISYEGLNRSNRAMLESELRQIN